MHPQNYFVELKLCDGPENDFLPAHIVYVESFDDEKNHNTPAAQTFVAVDGGGVVGSLLTTSPIEAIGSVLQKAGEADFFEVTTVRGNRALVRRSTIISRRGGGEEATIAIDTGQQVINLAVRMTLDELRAVMSTPTLPEPPPGLELLPTPAD